MRRSRMALLNEILKLVKDNPSEVREVMADSEVQAALGNIGVLPKVLELHAPSAKSRKTDGLGPTLCGINGTRHRIVTCNRCLNAK